MRKNNGIAYMAVSLIMPTLHAIASVALAVRNAYNTFTFACHVACAGLSVRRELHVLMAQLFVAIEASSLVLLAYDPDHYLDNVGLLWILGHFAVHTAFCAIYVVIYINTLPLPAARFASLCLVVSAGLAYALLANLTEIYGKGAREPVPYIVALFAAAAVAIWGPLTQEQRQRWLRISL